ncbi:RING-type E3 ubiquitin transferase [Forsythia ovata]|uniref:RING-type E3 ubiquitin transferase n=1 Tax=Forsythia ovata TaxID=205694 RepID=A0ABD1WS58_9LAMI
MPRQLSHLGNQGCRDILSTTFSSQENNLANPQPEPSARSNMSSRQPASSPGLNASSGGLPRPSSSGGHGSRPATPTGRPTLGSTPRSTLTSASNKHSLNHNKRFQKKLNKRRSNHGRKASFSMSTWAKFAILVLEKGLRNWNRWKEWRQQRQTQPQNNSASNDVPPQIAAEEETGDVPDGELCVICLMRRRRSAFIPCGHLVCCQRCALSIEREISPKCPVCRQTIRNSVRIYDS